MDTDSIKPRAEILKALNAKIPRDVISKRDAGNGRKLSYLEGWYVIDRLNEIFGQGNWSYRTEEMRLVYEGEVNGKFVAHYIAKVSLFVAFPDGAQVSFSDYGYGDGTDPRNLGKAHELAVKEAVTDGIKRCAKSLGNSTGLALYDKTQENVSDGEAVEEQPKARAENPSRAKSVKSQGVQSASAGVSQSGGAEGGSQDSAKNNPRQEINALISSNASVVIAQKKMTKAALLENMQQMYGTSDKTQLTDEQAKEFLETLERLVKQETK